MLECLHQAIEYFGALMFSGKYERYSAHNSFSFLVIVPGFSAWIRFSSVVMVHTYQPFELQFGVEASILDDFYV